MPGVLDALVGEGGAVRLGLPGAGVDPALALDVQTHLLRAELLGALLDQVAELLGAEHLRVVAEAPGALEEVGGARGAVGVVRLGVVAVLGVLGVLGGSLLGDRLVRRRRGLVVPAAGGEHRGAQGGASQSGGDPTGECVSHGPGPSGNLHPGPIAAARRMHGAVMTPHPIV